MDVPELFSIQPPPPPTKKGFWKKKMLPSTLDPRHGTLALDMEPSTFVPLNRLNILALSCHALNIMSGRE